MKTKQTILLTGLIVAASTLLVLSCDNPLSLGDKLDLDGPEITIVSPTPRTIGQDFVLTGTIWDKSAIDRMEITASINREPFKKQWRYTRGAGWQVSEDSGATWAALADSAWDGSANTADWVVPIDMKFNGAYPAANDPKEGEYMFTIQAWDAGGMSDDNSLKTHVLIFDRNPPWVEVFEPALHSRYAAYDSEADTFDNVELQRLRDATEWKEPELLGKFLTQDFQMQWQIVDNHDVKSIELRFYQHDEVIDNDTETELPDTYFYRYVDSAASITPNGSVWVPDLKGDEKDYDGKYAGGTIKKQVINKTTIKVAALCFDAAGHVNQEKVLGYFIYWPEAVAPWITYTDGMREPDFYGEDNETGFEADALDFTFYPGRSIKATAFQAQGVSKVEFELYAYTYADGVAASPLTLGYMLSRYPDIVYADETQTKVIIANTPRNNGAYSTIFQWDFLPPPRSADYVIKARAFDFNGNPGDSYDAVFRVQDITFPDFPISPRPSASEPLFKFIGRSEIDSTPDTELNGAIRISGTVADATEIKSVYMVWINPQSEGYAGMSQLAYFRDANYIGWTEAKDHTGAWPMEEKHHSTAHPNKVWKVTLSSPTLSGETGRQVYTYEQKIDLTTLNIGAAAQPLRSQVFLLRAENPDGKCTIITYAPQGDESAPVITIANVQVGGKTLIPNTFEVVPQFTGSETITVNGTWKEDSVAFLDLATYFTNNFIVSVNGITPTPPLTLTQVNTTDDSGTWTASFSATSSLRDTLVVSVEAKDIGGNIAEAGASWLIESDNLRLMRISSEDTDMTYNAGKEIKIFLEFNKAVQFTNSIGGLPALTLNTNPAATATYINNNSQSTRHYFSYTVAPGQNAARLDVTNLQLPSGAPTWEQNGYPFTWHRTDEEIRITTVSGHNGTKPTGHDFYARQLPIASNTSDVPYTLAGGKNITIDTAAPTITSITSSAGGNYTTGSVISITVTFNEAVEIDTANPPQILLQGFNGTSTTLATSGSVSGNTTNTLTFLYTVAAGDTTRGSALSISGHSGTITDLAGNALAANAFSTYTDRALSSNKFIDALNPTAPTVRILTTNNVNNVLTNTVNGAARQGVSGSAAVTLANVYNTNLWFAIQGSTTSVDGTSTGAHKLARLEYSIRGNQGASTNWVRFANETNTPIALPQPGTYSLVARQIDRAGNVSAVTQPLNFTWDPGSLISRIDSTTANGTYSNSTSTNAINVTVHFRKPLNFSNTNTQSITLNVTRGTAAMLAITQNVTSASGGVSSLSFTYNIANNDNTPTATDRTQYLDVTALSLVATDTGFTNIDGAAVANSNATVSAYLTLPTDTANRLGQRKDLIVQNNALAVSTGPTYAITAANDEATGTISITFNHAISKGSGDITIVQSDTGYRLPAVLTEAQSARYRSINYFNDFYTRGTNGFSGSSPDTTTKYVLNYTETAVVTPNRESAAGTIQRLAYDFQQAEAVSLPVTSQDVTVNGSTLTINLTGSNALQVLGASYTVTLPQYCVQDSLGYRWPPAATGYNTLTTPGINRPFIRVDKKINQDTIDTATGSTTQPWVSANFTNVIQTRARLDCRTPNSIVRYAATGQRYDARGAGNTATGVTTPDTGATPNGTADANWRNTETAANQSDYLTQPALAETGTGGTTYSNFGTHITVGDNTQHGYIWRISTRSRNGTNGTTNSTIYEEIAFRTVLTVQINGMAASTLGIRPGTGDHLWIRGGDALSSSSVPGFPLTWLDDWDSLRPERKRAGIRLLDLISATTELYTTSEWKWITWEVNVPAYFDIILGRDLNANNQPASAAPNMEQVWWYGPRAWAMQRGGWAQWKDDFKLYPGKHRWVCMQAGNFTPAGVTNFSSSFNARPALTVPTP